MPFQTGFIAIRLLDPKGQTPLSGVTVKIKASVPFVTDSATDSILISEKGITLTTDSDGRAVVEVPASDSTGLDPVGVTYSLSANTRPRPFTVVGIFVPAGMTVQAADVAPSPDAPQYAVQVTRAEFDDLVNLVGSGGGGGGAVSSVNTKTGDVVLVAADVGAETPSGAQTKATAARDAAIATAATDATTKADTARTTAVSTAAGDATTKVNAERDRALAVEAVKADLVGGVIPTSQVPAVALTTGQAVTSRAAMLALTNVQAGDFVAITTGADKGTYVLGSGSPTIFASWLPLSVPTDAVTTVNGQSGTVTLGYVDVGATPAAHAADLNNPHQVTKSQVGLGNVDNTSDASKPVSTAQATADNLRIAKSLVDAKGDLIVATADDTPARLAVGAASQAPIVDSTTATGLRYADVYPRAASFYYASGSITVAAGSLALIPFDTSEAGLIDTSVATLEAGGILRIQRAGLYEISQRVLTTGASGGARNLFLKTAGGAITSGIFADFGGYTGGGELRQSGPFRPMRFAVNDAIQLGAYSANGHTVNSGVAKDTGVTVLWTAP